MEYQKLKEQYGECVQKCARLEEELERSQKRVKVLGKVDTARKDDKIVVLESELGNVKNQLQHKTQLLDKVKILLQKAATKERVLQDQVS